MVKFGDVVRHCKEKVDRENNPFERYVEGGHMDSEDVHIRRWGEFGEDYVGPAFHRIFRKGQVLYGSRRTYLKKVAVADFDGITANTTFVLETKDQGAFMQELLPFLMLTDRFTEHSIAESKGSTNPYINYPDIAKFEFPLPPIKEQKRIAEILWAADETAEKHKRLLKDCVFLERRMLLHLFEDSAAWSSGRLGELGEVRLGRQRAPKYTTGQYTKPYLRVINVLDGQLDFSDVEEMDFNGRDFERYRLFDGDILVTEGDITSPYNVGRNAIYRGEIDGCCFQNTLIRLRCGPKLLPEYASLCLRYMFYKGVFAGVANTTTVTHLGGTRFSNMEIAAPTLSKQGEIADTLNSIRSQIAIAQRHVHHTIGTAIILREELLQEARLENV
jgi:type I restriction enzyme S subunit